MKAEIAEATPLLLGALYDAVTCALKRRDETPTPEGIRMADAARWIAAAEPATGLPEGTLIGAMVRVRETVLVERAMEQPLAVALTEVAPFNGLVSTLLNKIAFKFDLSDPQRPKSPSQLSTMLTRLRPVAEKAGLLITQHPRDKRGKRVEVRMEQPVEQVVVPLRAGKRRGPKF